MEHAFVVADSRNKVTKHTICVGIRLKELWILPREGWFFDDMFPGRVASAEGGDEIAKSGENVPK